MSKRQKQTPRPRTGREQSMEMSKRGAWLMMGEPGRFRAQRIGNAKRKENLRACRDWRA